MRHIEETLQQSCVRWMAYQYPEEFKRLHHSPNGGKRNVREAARFKAMGTKPGFPDISLLLARGGYHGLFIEMKTDKGRQSDYQRQWEQQLTADGYRYELCRTFEQFMDIINSYLNTSS